MSLEGAPARRLPKHVPLFRVEAVAHRTDSLLGDVHLPAPRLLTWLSLLAMAFSGALISSLFFVKFSRTVAASGWLEYAPKPADVIAAKTGTIRALQVKEGDHVVSGQTLATIYTSRSSTSIAAVEEQVLVHVQKEREALLDQAKAEQSLATTKQDNLISALASARQAKDRAEGLATLHQRKLDLAVRNKERVEQLVNKGLLPTGDRETAEQQVLAAKLALEQTRQDISVHEGEVRALATSIEELPKTLANRLASIRGSISQLEQREIEATGQTDVLVVASVSGRVANLRASEGQAVSANERLMGVIPDGARMQAQLRVPTREAGFLKVGMPVRLTYDPFPAQKFGHVAGTVIRIDDLAENTKVDGLPGNSSPTYEVTVALETESVQAYGDELPLRSGMTVHAQLIQDHRTAVEWILDPVLAATSRL